MQIRLSLNTFRKEDECQQQLHLEALVEPYSNQQHMLNIYCILVSVDCYAKDLMTSAWKICVLLSALMIQSSYEGFMSSVPDGKQFMALFPLHGTARYGTVHFWGVSTGYCTWYLIQYASQK